MIVVKDKYRYNWSLDEWELVGQVTIRKGLPPEYFGIMNVFKRMGQKEHYNTMGGMHDNDDKSLIIKVNKTIDGDE